MKRSISRAGFNHQQWRTGARGKGKTPEVALIEFLAVRHSSASLLCEIMPCKVSLPAKNSVYQLTEAIWNALSKTPAPAAGAVTAQHAASYPLRCLNLVRSVRFVLLYLIFLLFCLHSLQSYFSQKVGLIWQIVETLVLKNNNHQLRVEKRWHRGQCIKSSTLIVVILFVVFLTCKSIHLLIYVHNSISSLC